MLPPDTNTTPAAPLSAEEQSNRLTDADDIISPLTFPEPSVSASYVTTMASGLRTLGTSIADTGHDITSSWSGLNGPYSAPEAETLFAVLDPVATDGDTISDALADAATALENFAEDVESIKTRWSNLRVEAYDLRSRIEEEGDDWRKGGGFLGFGDSPLVEENQALIDKGGRIIEAYMEAENDCANAINAGIAGRTNFEEMPSGDVELDPNVFYHGFEQDLSELTTAWGQEGAQTDYGWWVDVSHSVWDFGVGAVEGLGGVVGAHSSEGWFQASWGDALKEYHWDNLTSAASLVGLYDTGTEEFGWASGDSVKGAWKDLAHSVVPWEEWDDRPGYVIGTAVLNIGAMVAGAALTATGVGAVVGVPLMAWRGMAILDGMGGSGRGGGSGTDLPAILDITQFGGQGAPTIDLTGHTVNTSGFDPARAAEVQASVERLTPTGDGTGEAGGGRPGAARPPQPASTTDQRPIQRPVQDPTVADALAFDDIVNQPDNRTFGDEVRSSRQDEIARVDQEAKTGPGRAPASDEGRWTAGTLFDGPDGRGSEGRGPDAAGDRVLEMAGAPRPNDTLDVSAARNTPVAAEHLRLNDTGEPGGGRSTGHEAAGGRGEAGERGDGRNQGADLRNRTPIAHNQGSGSPGSGTPSPAVPVGHNLGDLGGGDGGRRGGGETSTGRSEGRSTVPVHHRDGSGPDPDHRRDDGDRRGRDDDSSGDSTRKDGTDGPATPSPLPDSERGDRQGGDPTSSSDQNTPRGKDDDPVSVPKHRDDAQAKARELLSPMNLGTGKDFANNFLDLVNSKKYGPLLERAFYNINGDRFRADLTVNNQGIPILTRAEKSSPWILRSDLPDPQPPRYHPGAMDGSRTGVEFAVLQKMDTIAKVRQITLDVHKTLNQRVIDLKRKFENLKNSTNKANLETARDIRRPVANGKKIITENFGEWSAELAVRDNFKGRQVTFEEARRDTIGNKIKDEHGNPVIDRHTRDLPGLAESTPERPNPIPASENAPKNGNDQFDQIWRTDDGGFVIVEAKGSLETELGERTIRVGEGDKDLKRVSQGSRDYFEDILRVMTKRGGSEATLAREIRDTLTFNPDKLHYAEARGNPGKTGDYQGNSMRLFDIRKAKN
ncbi:hypothetical protein [Nocardiopsis sp. MG754419]|uniref:hypothetical protein n=1 Tax=Nocardiopsis sp. MG754419 TaxID=2259865 RepID=UPI001BA788D8|nr:hypothetical protein [Nocardiopsis sp. MG754419]MBR8744973.1 hypothetical protein [Nocardiopsis sp. MG754419]